MTRPRSSHLIAAIALISTATSMTQAELFYGLTIGNPVSRLTLLDSANPSSPLGTVDVTAAAAIVGIDFRPATGQLYGLDSLGNLYVIDTATGAATGVSGGAPIPFNLTDGLGFDFNPVVDRIRLVTADENNARLNPNPGAAGLAVTDTPVAFDNTTADGDPIDVNAGAEADIAAVAYSNNVAGATSTTLYVIHDPLDVLAIQDPPNAGTLNTVGSLGINIGDATGFDISGSTGIAYVIGDPDEGPSNLYTINLSTGAATLIGPLPAGIHSLAIIPEPSMLMLLPLAGAAIAFRRR